MPKYKGTGPFGDDYRRSEIEANHGRRRQLDDAIMENPLVARTLDPHARPPAPWNFSPGAANASAPGIGPLLISSKSLSALSTQGSQNSLYLGGVSTLSLAYGPRRIEQGGYDIPDGPLPDRGFDQLLPVRAQALRRSGQPAFARGTHANLVQPTAGNTVKDKYCA
ncbi:hypothetical protein T492DRAFT_489663 [Pavlovales sp. CCMP2436]|nr:hypothetical protein T492DRAFT_489663 [Pavlovales sp. CCMP2436]